MKILILGTSNSLLRDGWVSGLQQALPESEITNKSVGASAGTQFCGMVDINFATYDYVFFDSMPNDQEYYHSGDFTYSTEQSQQALYEIAATISNQTNLIIAAISKIDYLDSYEYIYRRRLNIARSTGAQFLDLKDILKHIHALLECDISLLYETPTHPASFLMKLCGHFIGTALKSVPPQSFIRSDKNFVDNFSWQHLGKHAQETGEGITTTITNSLMSETFLTIQHNQQITFSARNACLGFYINFRGTNAYANLQTPDETLQLNLAAKTIKDKLLKIFIPLPKIAPLQRLSLAPERSSLCATPIPHNRKANWTIEAPALSIAKIIFWNYQPYQWQQESENYEHDYRWLTDQVKRAISQKAIASSIYAPTALSLVTHFGRTIMYDLALNRCIQTNQSLTKFYPNALLPINIKFIDHSQILITTEIDGVFHIISGFQGGLCVKDALIGTNLNDLIGYKFLLEKVENNKFTIKCGQFYLRASKLVLNGGLTLDRLKADDHETFEVQRSRTM